MVLGTSLTLINKIKQINIFPIVAGVRINALNDLSLTYFLFQSDTNLISKLIIILI